MAFRQCRVASTDGKLAEGMCIKIAPHPFAEGNSRIARHGRLLTADGWRPVIFKVGLYNSNAVDPSSLKAPPGFKSLNYLNQGI
jgi:hypothetical protein